MLQELRRRKTWRLYPDPYLGPLHGPSIREAHADLVENPYYPGNFIDNGENYRQIERALGVTRVEARKLWKTASISITTEGDVVIWERRISR